MTDREIMQQALEALQAVRDTPASADEIQRAWIVSDLLQRRLAQPEQEPVGQVMNERGEVDWISFVPPDGTNLYTTPPQRTWVGSGDLEDSNAYLTPPQPEPVVYEDLATELFVIAQTSPADDGFADTIERIESWLRDHFSTPPQRNLEDETLQRFAALVVAAEREACAALVDRNAMGCDNPIYRSLLQANAHAIREMGQP